MKDNKFWIITSGISGFLAVAIGAFGAHGLKDSIPPQMMEVYKTGVMYHLIHSVVLLAIALSGNRAYNICAVFFSAGIILFSFSLYLYAITAVTAFAIITPFGGLCLLAGWLMVIIKAVKSANKS